MSSLVKNLGSDRELQQTLEGDTKKLGKLVVLEFVKSGSQICIYVATERDKIAEEMKDKADFYELDVDKFKKYAEKFKVEALPAFVVMQNFVKKRHVVGTDDLRKAIDDAYAKWKSNMPVADSSPDNDSEQRKPEANMYNSASNVESVPNNRSELENPTPTISNVDSERKQQPADKQCSIL